MSPTISPRQLEIIRRCLAGEYPRKSVIWAGALERVEAVLKRRSLSPAKRKTAKKKRTKKQETRAIWDAVFTRAGAHCECGCGLQFGGGAATAELDHFEGRARSESVESCWLLRRTCHRYKSESVPSAAAWLQTFIWHCKKHGYRAQAKKAEARLAFVEARSALTQVSHG